MKAESWKYFRMNYVNFIGYLTNPKKVDDLHNDFNADTESEALIVCLKNSLALELEEIKQSSWNYSIKM